MITSSPPENVWRGEIWRSSNRFYSGYRWKSIAFKNKMLVGFLFLNMSLSRNTKSKAFVIVCKDLIQSTRLFSQILLYCLCTRRIWHLQMVAGSFGIGEIFCAQPLLTETALDIRYESNNAFPPLYLFTHCWQGFPTVAYTHLILWRRWGGSSCHSSQKLGRKQKNCERQRFSVSVWHKAGHQVAAVMAKHMEIISQSRFCDHSYRKREALSGWN